MLHSGYMDVMQASTPEALLSELVRFTHRLEFETVSMTFFIDHSSGDFEYFSVDNAPAAYRSIFDDDQRGRRDPVMQHCRKQSLPIIWGQGTYTAVGQGEPWEEQAGHGYSNGISMALHLPGGRHLLFGAERDKSLPGDSVELSRIVADLQLLTTYAHEAATRVFAPRIEEAVPLLTRYELDTLRWTMEGKTAWEVGDVLGISERTTVMHLNLAMRKLGCVSKHQAVLKALRMGLIR